MSIRFSLILAVFFFSLFVKAQDTIKTEKLIIVKQYSPTVNDAFKIKQKPSEKTLLNPQPKSVKYQFINIPVASTFTPAKGRASGVILPPKPLNFNSYARLGFGNYTTVLGELFSKLSINRDTDLSIDLNHLSSQGGISELPVDDIYSNTGLKLDLTKNERNFSWSTGIEITHDIYNWYGIQQPITTTLIDDVQQTYLGLGLNGTINFYDSWLNSAKVRYVNFSDEINAAENFIDMNFDATAMLGYNQPLDIKLNLNYLTTAYDDFSLINDFAFYNLGVQPETQFNLGGLAVSAGVKLALNTNVEESETNLFIYPKFIANYNITQDINLFANVDGDLTQNTYRDFVQENPFVSPNLRISPTNKMYDANVGVQSTFGKLTTLLKVGYADFDNTYFFKHNFIRQSITTDIVAPENAFSQNNSFEVVYDDMTQLSVGLNLNYTPNEDLDFGFDVNYFAYDTDNELEAWNLPEISANLYGHYNFTDQWRFGLTTYFVGERQAFNGQIISPATGAAREESITLDAFIDLNFALDYAISDRLSIFVNANNLLSADKPRWKAYQVQGLQVLGGLTYKFDW